MLLPTSGKGNVNNLALVSNGARGHGGKGGQGGGRGKSEKSKEDVRAGKKDPVKC